MSAETLCADRRAPTNGAAPDLPQLRSLREAATIVRQGESTLRAAARRREIGHLRLGRRLFFSDADLLAYLSVRRVEATPR